MSSFWGDSYESVFYLFLLLSTITRAQRNLDCVDWKLNKELRSPTDIYTSLHGQKLLLRKQWLLTGFSFLPSQNKARVPPTSSRETDTLSYVCSIISANHIFLKRLRGYHCCLCFFKLILKTPCRWSRNFSWAVHEIYLVAIVFSKMIRT